MTTLTLETAEERELWMSAYVAAAHDTDRAWEDCAEVADAAVRAYRERCAPAEPASLVKPWCEDTATELRYQLANACGWLGKDEDEYPEWTELIEALHAGFCKGRARQPMTWCAPGASEPAPDEPVVWVVNDNGELGVELPGGRVVFLYKGRCLEYDGYHDDGTRMRYRRVQKREFGECAMPRDWYDPDRVSERLGAECPYTKGEGWRDLPVAGEASPPAEEPEHIYETMGLDDSKAHKDGQGRAARTVRVQRGEEPDRSGLDALRAVVESDAEYREIRAEEAGPAMCDHDDVHPGEFCMDCHEVKPAEPLDAIRTAYYEGGEPIASLEQEHGREAVAEALGFEHDDLAAEYHAQGNPPREVLDAVRANYPRAETGGAPTGPGWWWGRHLDAGPDAPMRPLCVSEVNLAHLGLTLVVLVGGFAVHHHLRDYEWGGPCLQKSADADLERPGPHARWCDMDDLNLAAHVRAIAVELGRDHAAYGFLFEAVARLRQMPILKRDTVRLDALTRAVEDALGQLHAAKPAPGLTLARLRAALDAAKGDA